MASMNYCFTVCRAADEKVQQETHRTSPTPAVDIPKVNHTHASPGAYFFGRFFSFNLTPPSSSGSTFSHSFTVKASSSFTDIDEDLF